MRTIRTTMAVMLMSLAFAAFQTDASAQARRSDSRSSVSRSSSSNTSSRSSSTVSRSSSSSSRSSVSSSRSTVSSQNRQPAARPSTTVKPSSGNSAARPSSGSVSNRKPSTTVTRPDKPSGGTAAKPSGGSMSKPSATTDRKPSGQTAVRPAKPAGTAQNNKPDFKPGNQNKPIDVARPKPGQGSSKPSPKPGMKPGYEHPIKPVQVHPGHNHVRPVPPRERHFMHYSKPAHFWSSHNHCYGYRVKTLPINIHRHVYRGITYFCYNDVWYRPYNGYYIVCRPPFGTSLAANLIADMAWTAVKLSYINTVAKTYSQINENNEYIAQQNTIIAQNNATIAAQNQQIAMNQERATAAYGLADQLGLVQSYASASSNYYYQDGVFYVMDADGQYKVIVPPAGALVETLPEDFEMVTLRDGNEYYRVDDTVYRITINEGKPYFEVLGQM